MLLYDAATSRISKAVPPFFLKEHVGARATTAQVARTHNTLLVINSKGQMPVCHTSSSPIHVINLCTTSLHIFIALPFTITVLHLHVIDGLHVLLQVPVPGVLHGWHDP